MNKLLHLNHSVGSWTYVVSSSVVLQGPLQVCGGEYLDDSEIVCRLRRRVLGSNVGMMLRMNKSDNKMLKVSLSYIMQLRHLWDSPAMPADPDDPDLA